ncbi:phosphatidylinositol kinase (PIK-G2), partial [Thraustotheca clavata]
MADEPKARPGSVPVLHTLLLDDPLVISRNSAPAALIEELPSPASSPSVYSVSPSNFTASEQLASNLVGSTTEITSFGLCGFLNMRENGPGIHRMRRYYCRLIGVLFYRFFSKEQSRDLSNAHMEAEVQKIEEWDGKGMMHLYRNAFRLTTSHGVFNVAADSEKEKALWKQYVNEAIEAAQLQMRDAALLAHSQSLLAASPGGLTLFRSNKEKEKPPKFKGQPTCAHPKCTVRFDNTKRQHHCRNCGDSLCSDHSYHFAPLPHLPTLSGPQRQCTRCFRVHRFTQLLRCILQVFVKNRHQRNSPRSTTLRHSRMATEDVAILQTVKEAINEPDFGVSDAIQALHLHRKDSDEVYRVIVQKLLSLSATHMPDFEFFLPQLFHLWASTEYELYIVKWTLLLRLLMTAAMYHVRLATSIHWLMRATIDDACGWGFGQSELNIPEYLKNRFAPCKLALFNLHMLVYQNDGQHNFKFQPDEDLRTMPIQTDLIQTYFDRLLALQQYDEGQNAVTPDFVPSSTHFFPVSTPSNGSVRSNSALLLGPLYAAVASCVLPPSWNFDTGNRVRLSPRLPSLEQSVFSTQLRFIDRLGKLAEALRGVTPVSRKEALPDQLAQLTLPEYAYYPLGTCDEPLRRFVSICIKEGTVFTTKARAPTLIWFEVENMQNVPETLWLTPAQATYSHVENEAPPQTLQTALNHDEIGQVLRHDNIMSSLHTIEALQPLNDDEEDDESVDGTDALPP